MHRLQVFLSVLVISLSLSADMPQSLYKSRASLGIGGYIWVNNSEFSDKEAPFLYVCQPEQYVLLVIALSALWSLIFDLG